MQTNRHSEEQTNTPRRKCNICNQSTNAYETIYFGEWMTKTDIEVHYYCLLLSTHLPQRGKDSSGILGFLISDIRKEIVNAKRRICFYCETVGASIMCKKCKKYLHLACGHTNKCLFQFVNKFHTYCNLCIPLDYDEIRIVKANPPKSDDCCYICKIELGDYDRMRHIYAKCCGSGYAHIKCVKIYALSAGYYLTCIWCKSKSFRDFVKYRGVFVPDRDANWELEKGAYRELYRNHQRCDMEQCYCPKGRDYVSVKWQIIICKCCGAHGAHNPGCIPGFEKSTILKEFQCDVCSVTEQTLGHNMNVVDGNATTDVYNGIDTSLYIVKQKTHLTQNLTTPSIDFSDDSASSVETVIHTQKNITSTINKRIPNSIIPTLTQSQNVSIIEPESDKIITPSVFPLKASPEIMKIKAIDDNDAEIQEKNKMVSNDSDEACVKVIDKKDVKKESLEYMDVDVAEVQKETQTNADKQIKQNTACAIEENVENIDENQIIFNNSCYAYPITKKVFDEIQKLNPDAATTAEEKQRIIAELQRINPYGITEVDDSESEESEDESSDKNSEDEEELCSEDERECDLLVQTILDFFE